MASLVTASSDLVTVPGGTEERLALLAKGDPAVVAVLYDEHHDTVRTFARRLLGDAAAAEDLVHDVFLAVPGAARRFRGDASLRSLLLSIAVNLARRHVRTAVRRRSMLARLLAGEDARDAGPRPDEQAEQRELAGALHRALDSLSVEQRVALVLCVVEERTSMEAAEIAGVPEGTMRTRVHHARKRLQEILRKRGIA